MSNLEKMKKKLLILNIVNIILFIIAFFLFAYVLIPNYSSSLKVICFFTFFILVIISRIIINLKNDLKLQIKNINTIKMAIEEIKEDKKNKN